MKITMIFIIFYFCTNFVYSQYKIPTSIVGGGGEIISGSNLRIYSTVGQTLVGFADAAQYVSGIGFWPTPVEDHDELIPTEYRLEQNYPNPFNPSTTIRFSLKERSQVNLEIFNVLGQTVKTLVDEELPAGEYETRFYPGSMPSGFYIYRITANEFVQSRKMLFLK